MKNEIAIGQTQELQIKKAKNQLSTVFSLIQSDEAIRLVNIPQIQIPSATHL